MENKIPVVALKATPLLGLSKRQAFDLPELKLQVMEHQVEQKRCSCGHLNQACFPVGVNGATQYGSGLRGLVSYLQNYQLLPEFCFGLRVESHDFAHATMSKADKTKFWQ